MDVKRNTPTGHNLSFKNYIGKKEKKCRKCGFVTFCLRVLYKHKLKCIGQLIGSSIPCCYCRRKFDFFVAFKNHKRTCVKSYLKKKYYLKKFQTSKQKIIPKASDLSQPTGKHIIVCPICCSFFKNQLNYDNHLQKGICKSESFKPKENFSARKSVGKDSKFQPKERFSFGKHSLEQQSSSDWKSHPRSLAKRTDSFTCMWCKSAYPTEMLLYKHLERNEMCAEVFYRSCVKKRHVSFKARKTVVSVLARKSFSSGRRKQSIGKSSLRNDFGGSARKSFSSPFQKYSNKYKNFSNSTKPSINHCPVCFEKFHDSFSYFQHQKKFNHWGKATKSVSVSFKCPFCSKEFFHIRARNIHLRNHADKSEEEIKLFLKKSTCNICSQIFESESVKQQHVKLEHRNELSDLNPAVQFLAGLSNNTVSSKRNADVRLNPDNLPSALKKKLDQFRNSCPICMTDYPSPFIRDKHFCKNHLERVIRCKFCFVKLKKGENLPLHLQEFHGDNLSYSCKECNVYFLSEVHVQQHALKAHPNRNPKSFVCCRSTIKTLNTEEIYGRKKSLGNNQLALEYYCDICQIAFQKLCGLQRHRQSKQHRDTLVKNLDAVHKSLSNLPPSPAPIPKKSAKEPELICCNECLEEFSSIKDFVPHRLSHFSVQSKYLEIDELNPYICEICNDEMDSHSNVQHHLFWHLQFKTTDDNITTAKKRNSNPLEKLGGQHVAKKSFTLQNCELLQEVTIGGIKKSLFTCDSCNIGFTTKAHYNVHVRKFCKMKKKITNFTPEKATIFSKKNVPLHSADNENTANSSTAEENTISCATCCSIFSTVNTYEKHKRFCASYSREGLEHSEANTSNADCIRSAMELHCAVAGCIPCGLPFSNIEQYFEHMVIHQCKTSDKPGLCSEKLKETEGDPVTVFHCTVCNCLLVSSEILEYHKEFCDKVELRELGSNDVDTVKSALEMNCALSACISCSLLFDNLEIFTEHMLLNHTQSTNESIGTEAVDEASFNGTVPLKDDSAKVEKCASLNANVSVDMLLSELVENCSDSFTSNHISEPRKDLEFSDALSYDSLTTSTEATAPDCSIPIVSIDSGQVVSHLELEKLRSNFSQLLYILVDDPDLMQQLGYGKELIDDVLIKVLQQMKKPPVLNPQSSDLERLRKNIHIFLDFCLKDQIMELIASGKTSPDEMVVEALKIFKNNTVTAM